MLIYLWLFAFGLLYLAAILVAFFIDRHRRRADRDPIDDGLPYPNLRHFMAARAERIDALVTDRALSKEEIDRFRAQWESATARGGRSIMLPPGCEIIQLRPRHRAMLGADIGLNGGPDAL